MSELTIQRTDSDSFARPSTVSPPAPVIQEPVLILSVVFAERVQVGQRRLGALRRELRDRLDIDPRAEAMLNGEVVTDPDTVIPAGATLVFQRRAGKRG